MHQFNLWKHVLHSCSAAVTPIIRSETRFYRDEKGSRQIIDLTESIQSNLLEEIPVSLETFNSLSQVLKKTFLEGIDEGEREAIAFLYQNRQKNIFRFCSADLLAIKCLGVLGLSHHCLCMEELFERLHIKISTPHQYKVTHSKQLLKKMLSQGFSEAHLHKM
ncbi:MAG: hypothetical protein JSR58_03150 [Verrucomicrobia bacterium]|nr:hypothetical protein [Verrucomicrobiota bacterium]